MALSKVNPNFVSQTPYGRRNLIINGAMLVAQRGTSGFTTNGAYTLDRHKVYCPAASFTASQSTTSPADFKYSLKVENTSAATPSAAQGGNIFFPLEGNTVSQLNWGTSDAKTVTLSFYVRSNTTGTYCINLENSTGSIGSGSHCYVAEYTINSANTWERKQITIPGPTVGTWATDNTMSIVIGWTLETGSNFTTATTDAWQSGTYRQTSNQTNWQQTTSADFHLTGTQLEVGDLATPFEHRSYADELLACQRYYLRKDFEDNNDGVAILAQWNTTSAYGVYHFPVQLRVEPSGGGSALSTFTVYANGQTRTPTVFVNATRKSADAAEFHVDWASAVTPAGGAWIRSAGNTYLYWDAEL